MLSRVCQHKDKPPILKWINDLNRPFFTQEIQMVSKQKKRCQISLLMMKVQVKITIQQLLHIF